ncbi:MAG: hypothetical protein ACI84C_001830 [Flavobacteriales bacterium]|jgi:hypothetical protein
MKNFSALAVLMFAVLDFSGQSSAQDPSNLPTMDQSNAVTCDDSCPWDFDEDGYTSIDNDFLQFLASFATYTTEGCQGADFNEDTTVDIQDLRLLLPQLGHLCPQ